MVPRLAACFCVHLWFAAAASASVQLSVSTAAPALSTSVSTVTNAASVPQSQLPVRWHASLDGEPVLPTRAQPPRPLLEVVVATLPGQGRFEPDLLSLIVAVVQQIEARLAVAMHS